MGTQIFEPSEAVIRYVSPTMDEKNYHQKVGFDGRVDGDPLKAVDEVGDEVGGHAGKVFLQLPDVLAKPKEKITFSSPSA